MKAIDNNKSVWMADSWVGDNTTDVKSSPVLVTIGSYKFKYVSKQVNINAAIVDDGSCWTWGFNVLGQLGDGTTTWRSSPVLVVGNHSFIKVKCLGNSMMALKSNGEVWCWGRNGGELGDNTIISKSSPVLVVGNHSFIDICNMNLGCMALKSNGEMWGWGGNWSGELGDGTRGTDRSSPVLVVGNHSFITLPRTGTQNVDCFLGLKADGSAWAWGNNSFGQLGDNTITSKSSPVLVVGNHSFIKAAVGSASAFGLKSNGEIWSWGHNMLGQLGDGTTTSRSSPVLVVGNHSFIDINTGNYASSIYALKADGSVWAWGSNGYGQIGDNTKTDKSSPVLAVGPMVYSSLSAPPVSGEVTWGQITGTSEANARRFVQSWRGDGIVEKMENDEQLRLYPGKKMESETVEYSGSVKLTKGKYGGVV